MERSVSRLVLAMMVFTTVEHRAIGAGFIVDDHGAAQLGMANAGAAAAAEDASTIVDNPAGLARLERPQLVFSGILVDPSLPFSNTGSRLPSGAPISGPDDNGDTVALLPNIFVSTPVTEEVTLGFGVFPSFGLATNYRPGWVGRYTALSTELTSLDLAPTLAYRLSPRVSVGVTPVARYTKLKLTSAIDFGAVGAALGVPGAVPGTDDGGAKIRVSGWSFGFNGGILVEPIDGTRIGIAYFYNEASKLTGSASFVRSAVGDVISASSGAFVGTAVSGVDPYPDHLNLGIVQSLSPAADIRAGLTWAQWSSFKEERIVFANPNQPDAVTNESWRDTFTVSLGGTYRVTPDLMLRAGIAYDQTPIPDALHRNPRIPDTDRIALAIGAGYALTSSITIDVAYEHLFGMTGGINATSPAGDQLVGNTRLSADLVALQLTFRY